MISPELLRRYPFFRHLGNVQLKAIAMLSNDVTLAQGERVFEADKEAQALFFLMEGRVDLHYVITDPHNVSLHKVFYMGHINPGEPFGISALIEPYRYTATALANSSCRMIEIGASALRALCEDDNEIAAVLYLHIAKTAIARLQETRIQLIATNP